MCFFQVFSLIIDNKIILYIFEFIIWDQTIFQSIFFNWLNFFLLLNFNHLKLFFIIMNMKFLIIWLILHWIISSCDLLVGVLAIWKTIWRWVVLIFLLFLILIIILTYRRTIFKFLQSYAFFRCHKLLIILTITWIFSRYFFFHDADLLLWYYCRNILKSFNFTFLKVKIFIYFNIFI